MLIDDILNNTEEINRIFLKYGYSNVAVMGSVAKRQETERSDIDFVAAFNSGNLEFYISVKRELEEYFDRKIDLTTLTQAETQYPEAFKNRIKLDNSL